METAATPRALSDPALLPDPSFERLLGAAWQRLPAAVRTRFGVKPAPGAELRYAGTMRVVRASRWGRAMAQLCRLIGTPLAPSCGHEVPVVVRLRLDRDGSGIVWARDYRFPGRAPVTCTSVKRAEAGGLVECVGAGLGMWLRLGVDAGALDFDSTGYFWRWRGWTLRLPLWLTPGALHVRHQDLGLGRFRFEIRVAHPLFGETFYQDGIFRRERSL